MMRYLFTVLVFLSLNICAYADYMDWRISLTCDAEARQARVELIRCDANLKSGTGSCNLRPPTVSEDVQLATVDVSATRRLLTPFRTELNHISFIENQPAEFGCRLPEASQKPYQQSEGDKPAVFLRIERYPTNWNWGGRCGASPYEALLWIQTGTSVLDLERPAQKIQLVGECGWGDPEPITLVTVNIDTGHIETEPKLASID